MSNNRRLPPGAFPLRRRPENREYIDSRPDVRIEGFEQELAEHAHNQAQAAAAQAQQTSAGATVQPVHIDREWRGILGGKNNAIVGKWIEIARFICFESHPVTIQSNVGIMMSSPIADLANPFTQPAIGGTVTITVGDNSAIARYQALSGTYGLLYGQDINGNGGIYAVLGLTGSNEITLQLIQQFGSGTTVSTSGAGGIGVFFYGGTPTEPEYQPLPPNQASSNDSDSNFFTAFPRVNLRIRAGSGNEKGGTTTGTYYCVAGDMFSVTGTYIIVDAQVFDDEFAGNLGLSNQASESYGLDPTLICPVSVSFGLGSPTSAEMPTKWNNPIQPLNGASTSPSEQVFIGQGRIKQAHGFNNLGTSSDLLYLMFFDIRPDPVLGLVIPHGAYPLFTIPIPGGGTPFFWDCISSSRFFQLGLAWGVSSTGDVYDAQSSYSSGYMRVDVELYSADMSTAKGQTIGP